MQVLERERRRLRARPCQKPRDQRRQLPAAQFLGRELRRALLRQRDVDQRREQRRMFGGVEADQPQRVLEVGEAPSGGRRPRRSAGGPIRRSGATAYSATVATTTIRPRCAASRRASSETPRRGATCRCRARRRSSANWPSPLAARSQRRRKRSSSSSRPTSGVSARAPKRRPPLARTIRKSVVGSGAPFSACAPRSSATNRPAT